MIPVKNATRLIEKLKAEWPGILHGPSRAARLAAPRLPPPAPSSPQPEPTRHPDAFAAWLEDRCEQNPNALDRSNRAGSNHQATATANGEFVGTVPLPRRPSIPVASNPQSGADPRLPCLTLRTSSAPSCRQGEPVPSTAFLARACAPETAYGKCFTSSPSRLQPRLPRSFNQPSHFPRRPIRVRFRR